MALESIKRITEMSNRNISWWGIDGRCVGLTTLPPSCACCLEIWEPQPPETLWACPGRNGIALHVPIRTGEPVDRIPIESSFVIPLDQHWGPRRLSYNEYRVIPRGVAVGLYSTRPCVFVRDYRLKFTFIPHFFIAANQQLYKLWWL
jgi:hypothetical protein